MRLQAAVVVLLVSATVGQAQLSPAPPRDRTNAATVGTGSVKGRVVDAQSGTGLPRARVRLFGVGQGPAGQSVMTDQDGGFAFRRLPAGPFFVTVDKATYLTARYPEAGTTFRSRQQATLGAGQTIDDMSIPMYHGGAVVGRILDSYGEPMEYVQVQALRVPKGGRGALQMRNGTASNDLGEFRIARLEPGDYLLFANPQRDLFVRSLMDQADDSEPRPIPTYYPGVPDLSSAQPIHVDRGATISADFAIVNGLLARVTGMLVDRAGQPVTRGGSIGVRPILKGVFNGGFGMSGSGTKPDGTFELRLAPGEYVLEGRTFAPGAGSANNEFGALRLTVGADLSNVLIQLGPGATVSGRVVFDGASAIPPPQGLNVPLILSPDDPSGSCQRGRPELSQDWTFTIEGVFGTCTLRPGGLERWLPKAILFEGRDITDVPMAIAPGAQVRGVELVMTDKRTELSVRVIDDRGSTTREYVAVLFPVDRKKWTEDGRYIRTLIPRVDVSSGLATTATPGPPQQAAPRKDTLFAMAPGQYFAIAVADLETDSIRQADLLERLSRAATRVTLAEGVPQEIDLRMAKW